MKNLLACLIITLIGCASPSTKPDRDQKSPTIPETVIPPKETILSKDLGKAITMEGRNAPPVWCIDISDFNSKGSMWVTRGDTLSDASTQLYFAPKACP